MRSAGERYSAWARIIRPESASMATNERALIDVWGTADALVASAEATLTSAIRPRQKHAARRTLPTCSPPHSDTPPRGARGAHARVPWPPPTPARRARSPSPPAPSRVRGCAGEAVRVCAPGPRRKNRERASPTRRPPSPPRARRRVCAGHQNMRRCWPPRRSRTETIALRPWLERDMPADCLELRWLACAHGDSRASRQRAADDRGEVLLDRRDVWRVTVDRVASVRVGDVVGADFDLDRVRGTDVVDDVPVGVELVEYVRGRVTGDGVVCGRHRLTGGRRESVGGERRVGLAVTVAAVRHRIAQRDDRPGPRRAGRTRRAGRRRGGRSPFRRGNPSPGRNPTGNPETPLKGGACGRHRQRGARSAAESEALSRSQCGLKCLRAASIRPSSGVQKARRASGVLSFGEACTASNPGDERTTTSCWLRPGGVESHDQNASAPPRPATESRSPTWIRTRTDRLRGGSAAPGIGPAGKMLSTAPTAGRCQRPASAA